MNDIKYLAFPLPDYIYFTFKNKCKFNDLPIQEVLAFAIEKFIDGDYDEEFGIIDDTKSK